MRERLPASAATLTEPPRRWAFEPGEAGEAVLTHGPENFQGLHTKLVHILTRHTLARAGLANRLLDRHEVV